jgi:hypothetical protein
MRRVAVLDSVLVVASPNAERLREFRERVRQGGAARVFTEEEIARRNPTSTVDLLRLLPGVTVRGEGGSLKLVAGRGQNNFRSLLDGGPPGGSRRSRDVSARASDGDAGCVLSFLNGVPIRADEVNLVAPSSLGGVEYYNVSSAPPQYLRGAACTVLLLWTK